MLDRPVLGARREALDRAVVRLLDPPLTRLVRHWAAVANLVVLSFVAGPVVAPLLRAGGLEGAAAPLYDFYRAICHQWAFRSFFVLGPDWTYSRAWLAGRGLDPFGFVGSPELGWKLAFCERNLAIFAGLLLFGLLYTGRWRGAGLPPLGWRAYAVLISPMALDGLTQLPGWRESTWELRVATGLLFGLASGWLMYPRLEWAARGRLRGRPRVSEGRPIAGMGG